MRELSTGFMDDLQKGILKPILERVKTDETLMLAIRNEYINIYYRGGNLLKVEKDPTKVEKDTSRHYKTWFDKKYFKDRKLTLTLPSHITDTKDSHQWVDSFQKLKRTMDHYFWKHPHSEREFQQLIVRENNYSNISKHTDYFVTDIEYTHAAKTGRFDLLALEGSASIKKSDVFRPVFIELKYGDGALTGAASVEKHLQDFNNLIVKHKNRYDDITATMIKQFKQLDQLNLLKFNKIDNWVEAELDAAAKPKLVFIFANHNPRNTNLKGILNDLQKKAMNNPNNFDLEFYVSSFAGYGLYKECMVGLDEFKKLLK